MKIGTRHVIVALVLAVHLGVDAFLISSVSLLADPVWAPPNFVIIFAIMAVPLAQGCLIALWLATSRMRLALRLPLALAGTATALFVLIRLLDIDASDPNGPGFTFLLISQALTVLILINADRLVRRQSRLWRSGWTEADARRTQFSLRQLLIWTAVLAITLGTGKALFEWLGWTGGMFAGEQFYTFQVLAMYDAMYAMLILATSTARVRWATRIVLFALSVGGAGALACTMPWTFRLLFGAQNGLDVSRALMISVPQIVYHTLTLWPLWLCGYVGQHGDTQSVPEQTTPASDNPSAS
jgi:hypothetical protein